MRAFDKKKQENIHSSNNFFSPKIQKKLKTGTVGDKYEVEADSVANKVVNKTSNGSNGLFQSKAEEEIQQKPIAETISTVQKQEMKEEEPVQKKSAKEEDKLQKKEMKEEDKVQKKEMKEEEPVQKKSDKEEDKIQKKEMKEEDKVQKKEKKEEEPVQKKSAKEEDKVQKKSKEKEEPIQAKCDDCEKEDKVQKKQEVEKEKPVQAKSTESQKEVQNDQLENKLANSKGSGTSLDKKTKQEMESGFGADFSKVKIHTDSNAIQMSQELGAQAFTHGNDIYFNKGKYNPESKEGKQLLAHELTHTIQQTGMVQKSSVVQQSSIKSQKEDLEATSPENPQFRGNLPLEKTNDDQMLISTGHKGEYVAELQKGLLRAGQSLPNFGVDGDFGRETRDAVINFQNENFLTVDGIVGPQTISALDNKILEKNGGSKDDCISNVTFQKGPFFSEESAGFFSTRNCPKVTITINVVAHIVNFHNCNSLNISIDYVSRTRRTIAIDNSGRGHFQETFTLRNHRDIHRLFFTMPTDCRGMGDSFSVSGSIRRHS